MAWTPRPKPARSCAHCGKGKGDRGRGLCARCWADRAVRNLHPVSAAWVAPLRDDPTAEELEALVEAGLRDRPEWWDAETEAAVRRSGRAGRALLNLLASGGRGKRRAGRSANGGEKT